MKPRKGLSPRRQVALSAVVIVTAAVGLGGCTALHKAVNAVKAVHNALHGDAAINSLTSKLKTSDTSAYEVTYVTTGSSPATIEYAASPPHGFAFDADTPNGRLDVFQGSAGQFACTKSSSGGSASASWSCLKIQGTEVDTYKAMYALYSGSYWIDFLKIYSAVAALHGVTITSSTMSVNGFSLQCALVKSGSGSNATTSTWCVTSQGILGYVSVSQKSADFEIKSYTSSPPASLFALPSGATISTIPTIPTTTS